MRQAVEVIISEKNRRRAPVIIAPIMLVAAKVIARRITEVRTVPRMPLSSAGRIEQKQPLLLFLLIDAVISNTAR